MATGRRGQRHAGGRFGIVAALILLLGVALPAATVARGAGGLSRDPGAPKTATRGATLAFSTPRSNDSRVGLPTQIDLSKADLLRARRNPKLDSTLNDLVARLGTRAGASEEAVAERAPISRGATVLVSIHTDGTVDPIAAWVAGRGGFVANTAPGIIEAYVPVSQLVALSAVEGVGMVRVMGRPRGLYGPTLSEGTEVHNADHWHANGYTGAGVKVGVIDVGFEEFGNLMGNDLPSSVTVRCYAAAGTPTGDLANCQTDSVHGTGVAEAVMDIAPGAQLYIANPFTHSDLLDTVNWMAANGVQVINHSVGWWWSGPGDGTSPYPNSPLASVDVAVAAGILWANAAGNEAESTWTGQYTDSDGDFYLEYVPGDETNFVANQTLPAGLSITILARWGDSWGGADTDINIGLFDSTDTLVASSTDVQAGGQFDMPFEVIQYNVPFTDDYYVAMYHAGGPTPTYIEIQEFNGYGLEHITDTYSIGEPADSANPGMLAVGAMNWATYGTIEDFSSRGPTLDGRTKPDIVGADRGNSAAYGYGGFSGTSQASPHVAGLAALVRGRFGYSPQQTADYLKQNAIPFGGGVPNNVWGYGLAYLPDVSEPPPPPPAQAFDTVWATTDALVASGGASYSWFWGPTIHEERWEPYVESPGGFRQVRYYDKSRMEINHPDGDQNSIYYVTNGRLTAELTTGLVQRGDATFEQRAPSPQLVAGDPSNNPGTPSYAAFGPYVTVDGVSNRSPDRTGQEVTQFLSGDGALSSTDSGGVTLASYQSATGHNIASVFWAWANSPSSGLRPDVGVDWLYVLGYPISEPYWINSTVAGVERRVLVQLFERRALTYTPANPPQFQVEFGNIGLHFLNWIDSDPPPPPPPPGDEPPGEGAVLYQSSLSDWDTGDTDIGSYFWDGSRYHISVTEPGGYWLGNYTNDSFGDLSASIDVFLEAGDGDGCLVVRAEPTGAYDYALCIYVDPDTGDAYAWGMYEWFDEFGAYYAEVLVDLYAIGDQATLENGVNLKIIAQGHYLWFFVDGELIGHAPHDGGPLTGTVGVTVVNYDDVNAEYSFTNLVVRALAN